MPCMARIWPLIVSVIGTLSMTGVVPPLRKMLPTILELAAVLVSLPAVTSKR